FFKPVTNELAESCRASGGSRSSMSFARSSRTFFALSPLAATFSVDERSRPAPFFCAAAQAASAFAAYAAFVSCLSPPPPPPAPTATTADGAAHQTRGAHRHG